MRSLHFCGSDYLARWLKPQGSRRRIEWSLPHARHMHRSCLCRRHLGGPLTNSRVEVVQPFADLAFHLLVSGNRQVPAVPPARRSTPSARDGRRGRVSRGHSVIGAIQPLHFTVDRVHPRAKVAPVHGQVVSAPPLPRPTYPHPFMIPRGGDPVVRMTEKELLKEALSRSGFCAWNRLPPTCLSGSVWMSSSVRA